MSIYKNFKKLRLKPNHEVSQWYMIMPDLKKQVKNIFNKIANVEKLLFLGDGDGISILLALFALRKFNNIKEICVFDIDERELNLYNKLANEYNVERKIKFKTISYNVIDKVPKEYKNYFDYFYINPPYCYETKPAGLGFFFWLERCKELTKENAEGCIVYPFNHGNVNIANIRENILNYLNENNFKLTGESSLTHRYHETECISKNLYVKKLNNCVSKYRNKQIPQNLFLSMYLENYDPPYKIKDNRSDLGIKIKYKKV